MHGQTYPPAPFREKGEEKIQEVKSFPLGRIRMGPSMDQLPMHGQTYPPAPFLEKGEIKIQEVKVLHFGKD